MCLVVVIVILVDFGAQTLLKQAIHTEHPFCPWALYAPLFMAPALYAAN